MTGAAHDFELFIRRVYRRYFLLRVIERTGLGVLGGCAVSMLMLTILLWRGEPGLSIALAVLSLGGVSGFLWGLAARPTPLQAAMEADRQLGWADLLGSALAVRCDAPDDPWTAAVIAAADVRCRSAAPGAVILNRLGARAWGGIGLSAALVLALAFLPAFATPGHAGERRNEPAARALLGSEAIEQSVAVHSRNNLRRARPQEEPQDADTAGQQSADATVPTLPPPPGDVPDRPSAADKLAADPSGRGTGASHSQMPARPIDQAPAVTRNASGEGILSTSGAGQSAIGRQAGPDDSSTIAGSAGRLADAPAWQTSTWPGDVQRAHDLLNKGQVPDTYRQVLRSYFDRP